MTGLGLVLAVVVITLPTLLTVDGCERPIIDLERTVSRWPHDVTTGKDTKRATIRKYTLLENSMKSRFSTTSNTFDIITRSNVVSAHEN